MSLKHAPQAFYHSTKFEVHFINEERVEHKLTLEGKERQYEHVELIQSFKEE